MAKCTSCGVADVANEGEKCTNCAGQAGGDQPSTDQPAAPAADQPQQS